MYTIKELFKIGNGPSSSHTMGPKKACEEFLKRYNCDFIRVTLYGSLALTGKGHLTDYIIERTLNPIRCEVVFNIYKDMKHPNTMVFEGYMGDVLVAEMVVESIGGGAINIIGEPISDSKKIYPLSKYREIVSYCKDYKLSLAEYVDLIEGEGFNDYIKKIYDVMLDSIDRGIKTLGHLPGKLNIKRKANYLYYQNSKNLERYELARRNIVAYAYAVSEENASGGEIITAPTCGASGIIPAVLRYAIETGKYDYNIIIDGLKVAGLIGNIVKSNASISGAEAGCQAEVGTACSMAAAFLAYIDGGDYERVESASEIALEHHLGLTCDPVLGYVQIPCIERNAVAALRAVDASRLSSYLNNSDSKISFDLVVETMLATGKDLSVGYRETSEAGLAKKFS